MRDSVLDDRSVVERVWQNGRLVAVKLCSYKLEAHYWLAFEQSFDPKDGLAIFYPQEVSKLRGKTDAQLRAIHRMKVLYGAKSKVRK